MFYSVVERVVNVYINMNWVQGSLQVLPHCVIYICILFFLLTGLVSRACDLLVHNVVGEGAGGGGGGGRGCTTFCM